MNSDIFGALLCGFLVSLFVGFFTYRVMDMKRDRLAHILDHVPEEIIEQATNVVDSEEKHAEDLQFGQP